MAALSLWGFRASDNLFLEVLLGVGAPLAFALTWGAFIGPKAPSRLDDPARLVLEAVVFGLSAVALASATSTTLGLVFAGAVVINIGLMIYLGQRRPSGI